MAAPEFITHGGYEIIRDAWLYVSNLMADKDYKATVTAIFLATAALGATMGPWRDFLRGSSYTGWMLTVLGALLMYGTMFQAGFSGGPGWTLSGQITVRDDILNKSQTISNLPVGLVAIATSLNKAQVGMESLVQSKITGPYTTDTSEVALATKMLHEATTGRLKATIYSMLPEQVLRSIWSYIEKDLSYVASANPSVAECLSKTDSLVNCYAKGANPAILDVVTWLDVNGNPTNASQVVDGQDAWNRINEYFTNHWPDMMKRFCTQFGFDSAATSVNTCRTILDKALDSFLVTGKTSNDFTKDILLGAMWRKYLEQLDSNIALSNVLSAMRTQSSLMSTGISAEQWMPHLKIVMTALIIGITPIVLLFTASTFYFQAAKTLLSFYVWLLMWAVMDKVAEGFWIGYSQHVWDAVKYVAASGTGGGVGIVGQDMYWSVASQTLAVLGGMRSMGMMFAGVITYGIFGFGGSMLAHLAGSVAARVEAGAREGAGATHPAREAETQVTQQSAKQFEWAAQTSTMTTPDWFGLGRAQAMKGISTAAGWGHATRAEAQDIGYQQMRESVAKAEVVKQIQNKDLFGQVAEKYASGIGEAELTQRAMQSWDIENRTLARQIRTGALPIGNLSTEQKEKVLNNVFGRTFSSSLKQYAKKHNMDYGKLLSDFNDFNVRGAPGELVSAHGVLKKNALLALGEYYGSKGLKQVQAGLQDAARWNKSAEISAIGTPDGTGRLTEQAGGETRSFDIWHQKIEGYAAIQWGKATEAEKKLIDEFYQQAKENNWRSAMLWVEQMKANPNKTYYWHWHRNRAGRFIIAHAHRGTDMHEFDLLKKAGDQTIRVGDTAISHVAAEKTNVGGGKVKYDFVMGNYQLKKLAGALHNMQMADAARYVGSLKDSAAYGTLITDKDGNIALLQVGNKVLVDRERGITNVRKVNIAPFDASRLTYQNFIFGNNPEASYELMASAVRKDQSGRYTFDDAVLQEEAMQTSKVISEIRGHRGTSQTHTKADGGGNLRVDPAKVAANAALPLVGGLAAEVGEHVVGINANLTASTGIGLRNVEEYAYNLNYALIRGQMELARAAAILRTQNQLPEINRLAIQEAREKEIVGRDEIEALKTKYYNQFFMKNWQDEFNKFASFVKGTGKTIDMEAAGKKDMEFGASAIVGGPIMAIKRALKVGDFQKALEITQNWANIQTEVAKAVQSGKIENVAKALRTDEVGARRYMDRLASGKPFDMIDAYSILHGSDVKTPEEGKQKPQVREKENENISSR